MNILNLRKLFACQRPIVASVRYVGSVGPLAAAFNQKQRSSVQFKFNWLQSSNRTGLFGISELKDSQGWAVLQDRCERNCQSLVEEVTSPTRRRNVAVIFDDLSDELCRVADMAEFVRLAHPDEQVAFAAQETCINISGLVEQLNTHTGIYDKLKAAVETGDINPETSVHQTHTAMWHGHRVNN